jgi:hypothetical protein
MPFKIGREERDTRTGSAAPRILADGGSERRGRSDTHRELHRSIRRPRGRPRPSLGRVMMPGDPGPARIADEKVWATGSWRRPRAAPVVRRPTPGPGIAAAQGDSDAGPACRVTDPQPRRATELRRGTCDVRAPGGGEPRLAISVKDACASASHQASL